MGLVNAPYIAVSALRMLFTEENWQKFKKSKGNPECAGGLRVECIIIYYIDDILIYTAKNNTAFTCLRVYFASTCRIWVHFE